MLVFEQILLPQPILPYIVDGHARLVLGVPSNCKYTEQDQKCLSNEPSKQAL